jgi:hypothetical protein
MRRFTILGLMGLVLGMAVAIAALRNADDYWAGGLLMATAMLISAAALGAFYHSGGRRAERLGFAVFAGGYFALAFLGLSEPNLNRLPTTWLLRYVHEKVAPPRTYLTTSVVVQAGGGAGWTVSKPVLNVRLGATPSYNPWKLMLPGAANHDAFNVVGHCLFALLAGLLGIVMARRHEARQDPVSGNSAFYRLPDRPANQAAL